ncbi:MAG: cobaltochelatase subunit CobN, partial [Planctomycetota bacterium]
TRYLHPQWIRAQMDEGYSGTLQVLKAVQFMWGWEVMEPSSIRPDQWQSLADVYVTDRYGLGTRTWLEAENEAGYAQMLERMLDAVRLGYWEASAETQAQLVAAFRQAALSSELVQRNPAVTAFVAGQPVASNAIADGRPLATEGGARPSEPIEARAEVAVKGMELKREENRPDPSPSSSKEAESSPAKDPLPRWPLACALLLVLFGVGLQLRRAQRAPSWEQDSTRPAERP